MIKSGPKIPVGAIDKEWLMLHLQDSETSCYINYAGMAIINSFSSCWKHNSPCIEHVENKENKVNMNDGAEKEYEEEKKGEGDDDSNDNLDEEDEEFN